MPNTRDYAKRAADCLEIIACFGEDWEKAKAKLEALLTQFEAEVRAECAKRVETHYIGGKPGPILQEIANAIRSSKDTG